MVASDARRWGQQPGGVSGPFRSLDVSGFDPALASRPLLLLDIDGVVNAYRFRPGVSHLPADAYGDLTALDVPSDSEGVFRFWTSPALVAELAALATGGDVEVAWLTTWQDQANVHAGPAVGLPWLPVAARSGKVSDSGWKARAACEALQLGRPLIWVDDEEIGPRQRVEFAASGVPHQLIVPDPQVGLTRGDVAAMRRFVTAWNR